MLSRIILALFFLAPLLFPKSITIREIITSPEFRSQTLNDVRWLPGGDEFTFTKTDSSGKELRLFHCRTGQTEILLSADQIRFEQSRKEKRFTLPNYLWAPDGRNILIPIDKNLILLDVISKKSTQLTHDNFEERDTQFSPDGKYLAYLKNDNLMLYDLAKGEESALTRHGGDDILVGRFDWTYEEEFSIRTGFEWSPDSKKISFFQLNVSRVPQFPIVDFENFQNTCEITRYAKAGDPNAEAKVGVVDIQNKKIVWMDCVGDADASYISRTAWTPDSKGLTLTWLNRRQNHLELRIADIHTGMTKTLLEENSADGWLEPERKPLFVDDEHFLWLSEIDGHNHIYRYTINGRLDAQLTKGPWDVAAVLHASDDSIFFSSCKQKYSDLDLYRIDANSDAVQRLSQQSGTHRVNMSPNGRIYLDTFSSASTAAAITLHDADGRQIATLTTAPEKVAEMMQNVAFRYFDIPLPGRTLKAMLTTPAEFDSTQPHPLLIYAYGGPGSHIVRNGWSHPRSLLHEKLVQDGYLVLAIDGCGTGDRGAAWKSLLYKHLGDYEIKDQIAGAKWAAALPYVDAKRIGIWGWSYGGYTTVMCLLKGGGVFKAGVAVAPVTDWRDYDSIYTERFMDLPEANQAGYNAGSALNFVDQLSGRLLLIHGSADPNVHAANTMQLAKKLEDAGKDFRMMIYPGKTHGLYGTETRVHVYEQIYRFITENL